MVSTLVLGTASVLTDVPGAGAPEAASVDVPAGSEFDLNRDDTKADLPEPEASPEAGSAPQVAAPVPDDLSSLIGVDTTPASPPVTGGAEGLGQAPATGDSGAGVSVDTDSPVLPTPQATVPAAPFDEQGLSISTDPAQPALPDPGEDSAGLSAPIEDVSEDAAPEAAVPDQAEKTPETGSEAEAEAEVETADAAAPEEPAQDLTPMAEATPEPIEDAAPEAAEEAPEEPAKTLPAAGTITNRAEGVTTNRLPAIVDAPEADAPAEGAEAEEPATAEDEVPQDAPGALKANAVAFDNPEAKPLMAIVLVDDGTSPIGLEALQSFPYPLSFAVDANWSGAAEATARYRAAGFEVLALADLPEGASAVDTEVAMQTYLESVPQAVAVMEGTGTGLQSDRAAIEQLAPILLESGHGLVMHPKGLNTAQKLMAREGVPSASVFRDFDANGQNASVIRRFLDQAAFKAGQQDEGVIMLGRLRADTISALLLWGLQDRAASVALAPVSAILMAE
ncbi:divergent polysaccharide deacetylase family protein [Roseovarius gaetbuli]|nr:divergent polysaccharide deacetylase family protein [Roseovarius gaetbuli]